MRFHGVVLLAAAVLLSSVDGRAMGITKINVPAIADPTFPDSPTKRILRTDDAEKDEDEDRGWNILSKLNIFKKKNELKEWLKEGATANTVLSRLNQKTRVHNSLSDPAVKKLDTYVSMYNKKLGTHVSTVATLTGHYSDEAVAAMIQAGMKSRNPETKAFAVKLEAEQFRLWGISKNTPPLSIFKKLNLVKNADNEAFRAMNGNAYQAFQRYLNVYNHRNRGKEITELEVLKDVYKYTDHSLALKIFQARLDGNKYIRSAAFRLQSAQFSHWDSEKVPPSAVIRQVFELRSDRVTNFERGIVNDYATWIRIGKNLRGEH